MDSGVPSLIANRVQWRPAGLASAESLARSLGKRRSAFLERAQRVSGWYERLVRSVQPFRGWTNMPFDFTAPSNDQIVTRQPPSSTSFDVQRPQLAPETSSLPVRSPIRLAILGRRAEDLPMPSENGQRSADLNQLPLALVSHAARSRREIRGGFPRSAEPLADSAPAVRPVARTAEAPVSQGVEAAEARMPSWPVAPVVLQASAPSAQRESREVRPSPDLPAPPANKSVVEQLVEQMVFPTPLPGLELRVIRRDEPMMPAKTDATVGRDNASAEDARGFGQAPPKPPTPPAPPVIDVNAIADKVYRKMVRNQQRARERRGLY